MGFLTLRCISPLNLRCLVRCCNTYTPFTEFGFKPKFSNTEQEKILNIINGSTMEHLLSLNISQTKIKSLQNYKTKKGSFKSLNELLEVDGLSLKLLEKLCQRIISDVPAQNNKTVNNTNKRMKQMVIPLLSTNTTISSAVGVHLASTGVSWAKIEKSENHLECWAYQDFVALPKKMLPTDTFKLAMTILSRLPEGDAYVFEGTSSMSLQSSKQPSTVAAYNQNLELSSMMIALINTSTRHNLSCEEGAETENRVYFLKSKLAARLFKTLVGNECVSSTATVLQLLENSYKGNKGDFPLPCTPIVFNEQLRNDYLGQSPAHKDLLGQALMLVAAFIDLCIKKNTVSINAVFPEKRGT